MKGKGRKWKEREEKRRWKRKGLGLGKVGGSEVEEEVILGIKE